MTSIIRFRWKRKEKKIKDGSKGSCFDCSPYCVFVRERDVRNVLAFISKLEYQRSNTGTTDCRRSDLRTSKDFVFIPTWSGWTSLWVLSLYTWHLCCIFSPWWSWVVCLPRFQPCLGSKRRYNRSTTSFKLSYVRTWFGVCSLQLMLRTVIHLDSILREVKVSSGSSLFIISPSFWIGRTRLSWFSTKVIVNSPSFKSFTTLLSVWSGELCFLVAGEAVLHSTEPLLTLWHTCWCIHTIFGHRWVWRILSSDILPSFSLLSSHRAYSTLLWLHSRVLRRHFPLTVYLGFKLCTIPLCCIFSDVACHGHLDGCQVLISAQHRWRRSN